MDGDDGKLEGGEPTGGDLDDREAEVLQTVIRTHLESGEPVGSQVVSRQATLHLSPATIRNVMGSLEERGLLSQPHTSAGRVPTDLAYRFYVDHLIRKPRVANAAVEAIDQALLQSRGEIPELLEEASRQLSLHTQQVGIVLGPELQRILIDHLEFVRIDARRVVAILVGRSGVVHNRILEVPEPPDQAELDRIGRYLTGELGGRSVPEMRTILRQRMSEERAAYDRLHARRLELGSQAIARDEGGVELFVEGASNLLESPEFSDRDVARAMLRTLEEKATLVELLGRVLEDGGGRVVIGEEHRLAELARCSLVVAPYGVGDRVMGSVGVVGPTRMQYARVIALVDHLSQVLSRLLGAGEH